MINVNPSTDLLRELNWAINLITGMSLNCDRLVDLYNTLSGNCDSESVIINGVCSDEDFIDTEHGILSWCDDSENEVRPFADGDEVEIIIRKKK